MAERLGPPCTPDDFETYELTPEWEYYDDDDDLDKIKPPPEELEPTPETGDNYVGVDILLPQGDSLARGRVVSRKRDADGNPIGHANDNAILDTRRYCVEFDDGEVTELTAYVIAESMYAQCDPDGNQYVLLHSIIDYYRRNEDAVSKADQRRTNVNGHSYLHRSTAGWELCYEWRDGSTAWQKLSDLKESHPVETAEFALTHDLLEEPVSFNDWWAKSVLKRRERIIKQIKQRKSRYLRKTHKFGIEVPKSVEEASYTLDRKNGNTLWANAIAKEMKNVHIVFKTLVLRLTGPIFPVTINLSNSTWCLILRWKTFVVKPGW
jgi:hypothetical protein